MRAPLALVAALFVLAAVSVNGQKPLLSPEGPLPITIEQAPLLFKQCSREAPVPEGKLWLPTATEVSVLEAGLAKHMATLQLGTRSTPASKAQYRGQYVGFLRGGVKHIYASYIPAGENLVPRGNAAVWCDGGHVFWGIVYNTAKREFNDLRVNGP